MPRRPVKPRGAASWLLRGAAMALVLVSAVPARADDIQAYELAKNPFDAGRFAEAHGRLSALLDDPTLPACDAAPSTSGRCRIVDPELIERARALDAASLLALKRDAEADEQIKRILRKNPQYTPNAALFPPEVIDRFTQVRGALRPELEAIEKEKAREELARRVAAQRAREADERWIAEVEKRAGEQLRVRPNSRWLAALPFGVGQFQNGDVRLGVTFAVGEALLGGASLVSVYVMNKLALKWEPTSTAEFTSALSAQIRTATTINQITFVGWVALTVAGVIQAQVAFVPEQTTKEKRPVPPRPKLAPVAAPLPGGALLGVAGTF